VTINERLAPYAVDVLGIAHSPLPGHLIVVEGTDGVGRSTQVERLKTWLTSYGYAVADTGLRRSQLVGPGIDEAKEGNSLGRMARDLYYATDFVDRLQTHVLPALRAGFVVLTDRYIYSLIARAVVRGGDPAWIRAIYGLAPRPDAVFYLKIGVEQLVPRVLARGGFDYWESGMDMHFGPDLYESFVAYQTRLLAQFDTMAGEFGFQVIDAGKAVEEVFADLRERILPIIREAGTVG
jgi:dTMP kinase